MATAARIAVVTGGNKGIGFQIAQQLCSAGVRVVLTARDEALGAAAVAAILDKVTPGAPADICVFHKLDLDSEASISAFGAWLRRDFADGIDVLVNNAAIAFKGDIFGEVEAQATFRTNVIGTHLVTEAVLPSLRPGSRIVNVASRAGRLGQVSAALQEQFTSPTLTQAKIHSLLGRFVDGIRANTYAADGWPKSMYGVSKLALVAQTKVLAREHPELHVAAMCPGWCKTDMSSGKGPRSAEEGADTATWLATAAPDVFGPAGQAEFFGDRAVIVW